MSLLIFIIALFLGLMLLSGALVVALGTFLNSWTMALVVVGCVYIVVAMAIYLLSVRVTLRSWQQRTSTIYEVSATIETIYREGVLLFRKIVESIRQP